MPPRRREQDAPTSHPGSPVMHTSDRLHALDAVRAFALLLGIALHATQPYVAGLPWMAREAPSDAMAAVFYTIHMYRMPLFFLIAGFFGRMMLERRGTAGFLRDRGRRILGPLVVGLPVVMLFTGMAYMLGALASGADLHTVQQIKPPPSAVVHQSLFARINLIHLWFLYYLVILYAAALGARSIFRSERWRNALDSAVRFCVRGAWGPILLALPIAAYYIQLKDWSSWSGLPAPFSLVPDTGALIGYGLFFAFGWLLHRQQQSLAFLQQLWPLYFSLAIAAWFVCRTIGGATPHWGPYLKGFDLLTYTLSYMAGAWLWSFGLIGMAMRFLSGPSPVRRYLADSSYWLYLMHIAALLFFEQVLHPLPWHWAVKYLVAIAGSVTVLLLSYHYLVRFTFIGATLNGRRHPRGDADQRVVAAQ
jgi:glucans biosynthesis protein C